MRLQTLLLVSLLVAHSGAVLEEERTEEFPDDNQNQDQNNFDHVITGETETVVENPVYEYHGVPLHYHVFHGYRVVDPTFELSWDSNPRIDYVSHIHRYRVAFPIHLKHDFDLPSASDDVRWLNLDPTGLDVHFFGGSSEACGSLCRGLSVKVQKTSSGRYYLIFYCSSQSLCSRTAHYFVDGSPNGGRLFSFLEFTINGMVDGSEYTINTRPAPSPVDTKPVKPVCPPGGSAGPSDGLFRFESNKILLYTIKAKIGQKALHTFLTRGNNAIPSDRSLPRLYRSDALDSLASTISRTGYTKMVAEMRTGGSMVAQVVFDVSNPSGLNKENWFSASRIVSSRPFSIGNSGFNYFSIRGDQSWHRSFFINYVYPGCPNDHGFWVVLDGSDACPWGRAHWTGSPPLLIYNGRGRGVSYQNGHAATQADQFLIYLKGNGPDKLAAAAASDGCSADSGSETDGTAVRPSAPVDDGLFRFESGKILLYTTKAKIGQKALHTFLTRGNNAIPSDRSLPRLYRSDALDSLASTISRTGYTKMVAEMRTGGSMVAQVVFDVSNPSGLNKENWFSASRVVSSRPFSIGNSGFNYFSIRGDQSWHRSFFINYVYPGCPNDHGFWVVLDGSDACPWGRAHWTGSPPLLIYNGRGRGVSYQNGHAATQADRFLIYLQRN